MSHDLVAGAFMPNESRSHYFSNPVRIDRPIVRMAFLFLLICGMIPMAKADCSSAHIRDLSNRGKSVATIARQCGMSEQDVSAALKPDEEDSGDESDDGDRRPHQATPRLPSGSQISTCGCWGFVGAGAGQSNPSCASGYEHAVACPGVCAAGGMPWARVCQ